MTLDFPDLTSPIRLYVERDGKTSWTDYPPSITRLNMDTSGAKILLATLNDGKPAHEPVLIFDDTAGESNAEKIPESVRDATKPCCQENEP